MTNEKNRIRIDVGAVDVFPAIVDYDFIKMRPRGGSSRIDFFSYGKLSGALEKVRVLPRVFIKKDDIFFEKGLFLLDFSKIETDAADMADMIKEMGESKIYIEDSARYSVNPLTELLAGTDIVLMDFSEKP